MTAAVETMAYANATPWHGLGERVDDCISTEDMLKAAGLDWKVEKHQMFAHVGEQQYPTNKYALMRDSDKSIFSYVGPMWHPLQNADALDFFRKYTEAGSGKLETAGSLNGGKLIWALMKLPHNFEVSKGDQVAGYILLTSPHEVGKCITMRTTGVRVVCANTLAMAMHDANGIEHWKQSHIQAFNVDAAREQVEMAHQELLQYSDNAKLLKKLTLTMDDATNFVLDVFQPGAVEDLGQEAMNQENWNDAVKGILESYQTAPGAEPGTGWGMLNGVTHWADHKAGRSADARLRKAWFGGMARRKLEVQERLLEMAA